MRPPRDRSFEGPPGGTRPFGKFKFLVEIDGLTIAHFQSINGLSHEVEVLTYQEGGVNDRLHKLPAQGSYPNLTLKTGYINTTVMEGWHVGYAKSPGTTGRKNGSIVLLNDDGSELCRWNFTRAWPVKWEGPELDSGGAQIAVETLEIAHEGLVRA